MIDLNIDAQLSEFGDPVHAGSSLLGRPAYRQKRLDELPLLVGELRTRHTNVPPDQHPCRDQNQSLIAAEDSL